MIDLSLLRKEPKTIAACITSKDPYFDVATLISLDAEVRKVRLSIESLRHEKNDLAKQAQSTLNQEIRNRSIEIGKILKGLEKELNEKESELKKIYYSCPNLPRSDVPVGDQGKNVIVCEWGKHPTFSFPFKNHLELGAELGWFDFSCAAKMSGSNFALYKGDGVRLMYALAMFLLEHNNSYGYNYILPPYLINETSLFISGNFPKFKDQVYATDDGLYLTPTSEVNLTNIYRDYIFDTSELPVYLTSWTSCFRREAGAYGAEERGLIRMHQFEKIELYTFCVPDQSNEELERMRECATSALKKLNLAHRVALLATQEVSFASAKTYDIEVWIPGQNRFYEVSSLSNCTDFQARRGKIRYRAATNNSPQLVHTLNGSSIALSRLMVALMEHNQQQDGSIKIPAVLNKYGLY